MSSLIDKSTLFSLRNDASCEILNDLNIDDSLKNKVIEVPDLGMFFPHQLKRKTELKRGLFQPAVNGGFDIITNRYRTAENYRKILNFVKKNNLKYFHHIDKDWGVEVVLKMLEEPHRHIEHIADVAELEESSAFTYDIFKNIVKTTNYPKAIEHYFRHDFSVGLRGHGQIIPVAINLPSLYLSTQPKVYNFAAKNDLLDFTIDINEAGWHEDLLFKFDKLKNDKEYLNLWYEKRDIAATNANASILKFMKKIKQELG